MVWRKTSRMKMLSKLRSIKMELNWRMHGPIEKVGAWLSSVLRGHYRYYGVPRNSQALNVFRHRIVLMWKQTLSRRSHLLGRETGTYQEQQI